MNFPFQAGVNSKNLFLVAIHDYTPVNVFPSSLEKQMLLLC
jgi:hypothetical protein